MIRFCLLLGLIAGIYPALVILAMVTSGSERP